MSFPVVLDACVLIPMPIADLLLRLATAKEFRPLWSDEILNEVESNLVKKLHKDPHSARRRVNAMRGFFPDALVENYESLVPAMTNDPKDRHVLAAAVRSRAELIVTSNQKDFPVTALKPYDVAVRSPMTSYSTSWIWTLQPWSASPKKWWLTCGIRRSRGMGTSRVSLASACLYLLRNSKSGP